MELVGMKNCVVVKTNTVERKAIGFGKAAELLKAGGTRRSRGKEQGVDNGGSIADGSKHVAIAL
jgi:hypothetical protein